LYGDTIPTESLLPVQTVSVIDKKKKLKLT
jgi:hypothetical protein